MYVKKYREVKVDFPDLWGICFILLITTFRAGAGF
jgi:hypothetical protein